MPGLQAASSRLWKGCGSATWWHRRHRVHLVPTVDSQAVQRSGWVGYFCFGPSEGLLASSGLWGDTLPVRRSLGTRPFFLILMSGFTSSPTRSRPRSLLADGILSMAVCPCGARAAGTPVCHRQAQGIWKPCTGLTCRPPVIALCQFTCGTEMQPGTLRGPELPSCGSRPPSRSGGF